MHEPNAVIPSADVGIARAEADGSLQERDYLLERSGLELAPTDSRQCVHMVAVQRDHHLVFGNGLLRAALRSKHLALAKSACWLRGDAVTAWRGELFGAGDISCRGVGQAI
jgi:hypothetical protein